MFTNDRDNIRNGGFIYLTHNQLCINIQGLCASLTYYYPCLSLLLSAFCRVFSCNYRIHPTSDTIQTKSLTIWSLTQWRETMTRMFSLFPCECVLSRQALVTLCKLRNYLSPWLDGTKSILKDMARVGGIEGHACHVSIFSFASIYLYVLVVHFPPFPSTYISPYRRGKKVGHSSHCLRRDGSIFLLWHLSSTTQVQDCTACWLTWISY